MLITFNGPDNNFFNTGLYSTNEDGLTILSASSTSIVVQNPDTGAITTISGTGFTFSPDGDVTGGTMTGATFQQSGVTVASFTGFSWPVVGNPSVNAAFDAWELGSFDGWNDLFNLQTITLDASGSTGIDLRQFTDLDLTTNTTITGSDDNDVLGGGSGDDVINPGNNPSYDTLRASEGDDTYILSGMDATLGGGYVDVLYGFMSAGITATMNAGTNTMSVSKGVNGTDTFTDIINPWEAGWTTGGIGLFGTQFTDVFNITTGNETWMQVSGGNGVDTYNLNLVSNSTVRLNFLWDGLTGPTNGVNINLGSGGIIDDGFGNSDVLNVTGTGRLEIRGTVFDDTIIGGTGDDRFILHQGNDSADGGFGYDTLRYDRSNVGAINVDLNAGTVTGLWNGQAFTDTISNFEEIRGSRTGNDIMSGDANDNTFRGRGGNDTLSGQGGNDRLYGEDGNDTLYGGDGNDSLYGGAGDDTLNAGDNSGGGGIFGYDDLFASTGNDTLIFTDSLLGYQGLRYEVLNAAVTFNIDIGANTGTVDKGINGMDTLVDIANPAFITTEWGGLGLHGTNYDDVFNITQAADHWLQIRGGLGNDTLNLILNGGIIRVDYRSDGFYNQAINGVNINLATGVVSDDGFGTSDTLNVTRNGGTLEIRGTDWDDTIIGSNEADRFILRGGNDSLNGGGGIDMLRFDRSSMTTGVTVDLVAKTATGEWNGFAFNHSIASIEQFRGSSFADMMTGNGSKNTFYGRDGDDTLYGGGQKDMLAGEDGNDTIYGGDDRDEITGGIGEDHLYGDNSGDTLSGNDGNDLLYGGKGNDTLNGGNDLDTIFGGDGNDILFGNAGDDFLDGKGQNDSIFGGDGNDTILGRSGNDELDGKGDNDSINGGEGLDTLWGRSGEDTLAGGTGEDTMYGGDGNDMLSGQDDIDEIYGGNNNDMIYGGDGEDMIYGGNGGDGISGDAGKDLIYGGDHNDIVYGGDANDTIYGDDGKDTLYGDNNNDRLYGGNDRDVLYGNAGKDRLYGGNSADELYGGDGNDQLYGGKGDDTLDGKGGNDRLYGGDGTDLLLGKNGRDTLEGKGGNDELLGGSGNDVLKGQDGDDSLNGGSGEDRLIGGAGDDTMNGGADADTFVYNGDTDNGSDVIDGFANGTDMIEISGSTVFADLTIDQTSGTDTVITWGVNSITLTGVTGTIDADDFNFV